ncbi:MAG: SRPBCC family protein [Pyrinomonadaceae bacterium]
MKKWLIRVALILLLLIVGVVAVGFMIPADHRVSRMLQTKQSPQTIWDVINDHDNEPKWRHDVASVQSLGERNGKPVWKESYKDGNTLELATTESKPPTRMVREIAEQGPFSGRWEIDIQPNGTGSSVRVTEVGKIPNPVFRFVSKFVIGQTTQMERYLTSLAGKYGEPAQLSE